MGTGGADPEPARARIQPRLEIARIQAANDQQRNPARKNGEMGFQNTRIGSFGRKQLERMGTGLDRRKCLGRGEISRRGHQADLHRSADDFHVGVGRNHDFPSGVLNAVHVAGFQHRSGTDQRVCSVAPCKQGDALKSVWRIERHLDDPNARAHQCCAHGLYFGRGCAAKDGDERALAKAAGEFGSSIHQIRSMICRIPLTNAFVALTLCARLPAAAIAAA
mgnify:CR=1 FL=1